MEVRTFYWDAAARRHPWSRRSRSFRFGNAGDAFNRDLLEWAYPSARPANVADAGGRLLLVGSVAHRALEGDVLNGVGVKSAELPPAAARVQVRGLRGPHSVSALARAGYDTSGVRFLGDPGLLIGRVFPRLLDIEAEPGRTIFVPHYRERSRHTDTARYEVVSVDAPAVEVGCRIRQAELVLTSSLHGLIWAHALERPAVLVSPSTDEPALKYEDYLLSVGGRFDPASDIHEALHRRPAEPPANLSSVIDAITLPSPSELRASGIATDGGLFTRWGAARRRRGRRMASTMP